MAEGSHNSADDDGSDCLSKNICTAKNATNPLEHDVTKELRSVPGNNVCADCNSPEPDWASLNLGILICIECSGVHRNLGVHISKVQYCQFFFTSSSIFFFLFCLFHFFY